MMKSFKIILAVVIAFGLIWFFFGKKNEETAKPQGDKNHITVNAPPKATPEESKLQMTPTARPESMSSPVAQAKPSPPAAQTNAANKPKDRFSEIVTIKEYDPKNPQPGQTNTPAGKYYKRFESKLVLGQWDGTNTFTPLDPPQTIDISKSYPISLPYGELLTKDDLKKAASKRIYTDSEGRTLEEWYDVEAGTMRARVISKP